MRVCLDRIPRGLGPHLGSPPPHEDGELESIIIRYIVTWCRLWAGRQGCSEK